MQRTLLIGAALAALSAAPAHADTGDHAGFAVSFGGQYVDAGIDYSGSKPDADLSGAVAEFRVSYDHQFGPVILGASWGGTVGDGLTSPANRDGNYLVQGAELDRLSSWELRAGVPVGRFMPYAAGGQITRELTVWQSCPADPASVVAGFCGNDAYEAQRAGLSSGSIDDTATMWRVGIEATLSPHAFVDLSYMRADFGAVTVALDPDPAVIPPTDPDQSIESVSLRLGWRF